MTTHLFMKRNQSFDVQCAIAQNAAIQYARELGATVYYYNRVYLQFTVSTVRPDPSRVSYLGTIDNND